MGSLLQFFWDKSTTDDITQKKSHFASSFLCMRILCIRICICVCSYVYIFHMCLHQSDVVTWRLHTYVCMRLHMHMYIYLRNNFKR